MYTLFISCLFLIFYIKFICFNSIFSFRRLQPGTEVLLKAFLSENVSEKKTLVQIWKKDDKC